MWVERLNTHTSRLGSKLITLTVGLSSSTSCRPTALAAIFYWPLVVTALLHKLPKLSATVLLQLTFSCIATEVIFAQRLNNAHQPPILPLMQGFSCKPAQYKTTLHSLLHHHLTPLLIPSPADKIGKSTAWVMRCDVTSTHLAFDHCSRRCAGAPVCTATRDLYLRNEQSSPPNHAAW